MELRVLGSGSKGNSYALVGDDEILLLEAGISFDKVKKGIDFQINKVVGCLISHQHKDHLGYIEGVSKMGIPIFTNDETEQFVEDVCKLKINGVREAKMFELGNFKIVPFYLPHDNVPNFGYLIYHKEMGNLLFMTDYEYCPWVFKDYNINHFLIECNYINKYVDKTSANYVHVLKGHAELETTVEFITKNTTKHLNNIILCHLSENNADETEILEKVKDNVPPTVNVFIAEEGLKIKLKE